MAYVDYSSHWVLDQFLTYLEANVLGSNDEHLYDTFAVEHNINTATVDGTHKTNSITWQFNKYYSCIYWESSNSW